MLENVARDPASITDVIMKVRSRFTASQHRQRLVEYASLVKTPVLGISTLLSVEADVVRGVVAEAAFQEILAELAHYEIPPQARRMGGPGFLEACYAVTRIVQPAVVLETGVAHGYSSAVILQALHAAGRGKLYSVDLPMFRPRTVHHTGGAVPRRLRSDDRWELRLGSDRRVLPSLLKRTEPIDFFFYDSDTSYESMLHTWELVWPCLRAGAVILMNGVHANDAFLEFSEAHHLTPMIVPQPKRRGSYSRERNPGEKIYYLGLLRKPIDR